MNAEFKECLRRKKIWEFSRGKSLAEKELKIAEKDFGDGKEGLNEKNTNGLLCKLIIPCSTVPERYYTLKITVRRAIIV